MNSLFQKLNFGLILILLLVGVIGTILFFPLRIDNVYTCLYHRFAHNDMPQMMTEYHLKMLKSAGYEKYYNHRNFAATGADEQMPGFVSMNGNCMRSEATGKRLISRYIFPFGFFWWGSLAILIIGFFLIRKKLILK